MKLLPPLPWLGLNYKKNALTVIVFFLSGVLSLLLGVRLVDDKSQERYLLASARANVTNDAARATGSTTIPTFATDVEIIILNQNSTLAPNIETIWHSKSKASITVELKITRKCYHPALRGRIAGYTIAIIDWEEMNETSHSIRGHYHVPVPGIYHVEIIGLFCNSLKFHDNFTETCLENPLSHRLTEDGSFINVENVINDSERGAPGGFWYSNTTARKHRDRDSSAVGSTTRSTMTNDASVVDDTTLLPDPLFTRIQPHGCYRIRAHNKQFCERLTSLARFSQYEFRFNDVAAEALSTDRLHRAAGRICLFGSSHSRYLASFLSAIINKHMMASVTVEHLLAKTPNVMTLEYIKTTLLEKCSKVVIDMGHWQAGWPWGRPTLFPAYEEEMSQLAQNIHTMRMMNATTGTDFYIWSQHLGPIGYTVGACPPTDWRSPPVMQTYNGILRSLCSMYDLPYIDTDFIIAPLWDAADDWCHFNGEIGSKASIQEAYYILGKLFDLI